MTYFAPYIDATGILLYAAFALALPVGISSVTETEK
jgi:hypothetical protein